MYVKKELCTTGNGGDEKLKTIRVTIIFFSPIEMFSFGLLCNFLQYVNCNFVQRKYTLYGLWFSIKKKIT
jgi:hypothetical protein